MTTLSDFTARVKLELNRGSAYDAQIPGKIRDAVRSIERNWSLQYMHRFVTLTLSATKRSVSYPAKLKLTRFMRFAEEDTDGNSIYTYLKRTDPQQVAATEAANPTGYWQDGRQWIWFDNAPEEDLTLEWGFYQYSDWPLPTADNYSTFEHFLLDVGEDVLLAGTLVEFGTTIRELELLQAWGTVFAAKVQTLNHADIEGEFANEDARMIYD